MSDDRQWRRPTENDESSIADGAGQRSVEIPPSSMSNPLPTPYAGPPRSTPPPPGWRPRVIIQTPPPRPLPPQDHGALDRQEREARTVTYGLTMVAAAIMAVVLFMMCAGRTLW